MFNRHGYAGYAEYCKFFCRFKNLIGLSIGRSKVAPRTPSRSPRPPSGPISFIFMRFSAKILSNNRFLPQTHVVWEILDPPLLYTSFCLLSCINFYFEIIT